MAEELPTPPQTEPPATEPPVTPPTPPTSPALQPIPDPWDAVTKIAPPEGFTIPEDRMGGILELVNGAKSREELIGGLLGLHAKEIQTMQTAASTAWEATQTAWQEELKNSPDFGKEKLESSLTAAKEAALKLGGPGFVELLDLTGAGNNIHMVRLLTEAHKLLPKEGTPSGGNPTVPNKSLAQRLFPN